MTLECSKCGREMVNGFMLDRAHLDYRKQQTWVEGVPEKSFWSGYKTSNRGTFGVDAFRCPSCGKLDLFATASVKM